MDWKSLASSRSFFDPAEDWLHWSIPDPVPGGTKAAFDATVTELADRIASIVDHAA